MRNGIADLAGLLAWRRCSKLPSRECAFLWKHFLQWQLANSALQSRGGDGWLLQRRGITRCYTQLRLPVHEVRDCCGGAWPALGYRNRGYIAAKKRS